MAKDGLTLGLEITELRLGLPGGSVSSHLGKNEKKRAFTEIVAPADKNGSDVDNDGPKGQTKNQVVGWPPVCSYRRKNSVNGREGAEMYVKVSMDGAPFLRKIDLSTHKEYSDLFMALEKLFGCSGIGEALKDADNFEYVPIYEDKESDWMLVGDVPWEMFTESCKKLRVMKRLEAKGMGLQTKDFLQGIIKEGSL